MNKISTYIKSFSLGIFILLFGTFSNQLKAQTSLDKENLSLVTAIQYAVDNHPLIKEAEDRVSIAKAKTQEQQSSFYPQANVNLNYNFIGPLPYIQLPIAGGGKFHLAAHNNYDGGLAVNYLIYDFNRRKEALKLLQSNQTTASEKINLIRNQLAFQTADVYYSILYFQKSIDVMNQQIQDLNEHMSVARKLVLTGSATALDTLSTNVRVTALTSQKINLQSQLEKTCVLLKSLMNYPEGKAYKLTGKFEETNYSYTLAYLIQKAYSQREELTLNKLYTHTANIQKALIEKINMPILDFHSNFGVKNGYPDHLKRLRANYVLGLSAEIPVFDGYLRKAKITTAGLNIQSIQDHASVIALNIRTEVEQAMLDYKNKIVQLKSVQEEIVLAEAAIKQAKGLYKSGSITNTTLLDTETSLAQARLKYTYQLYLLTLSHYKLMQATGEKIW